MGGGELGVESDCVFFMCRFNVTMSYSWILRSKTVAMHGHSTSKLNSQLEKGRSLKRKRFEAFSGLKSNPVEAQSPKHWPDRSAAEVDEGNPSPWQLCCTWANVTRSTSALGQDGTHPINRPRSGRSWPSTSPEPTTRTAQMFPSSNRGSEEVARQTG
jgi:hypothetical protein